MTRDYVRGTCIFCGRAQFMYEGDHHMVPKQVRRMLGLTGQKRAGNLGSYKVPMCRKCHTKLNRLLQPLIKIIKYRKEKVTAADLEEVTRAAWRWLMDENERVQS
jgi:hypothetical protein